MGDSRAHGAPPTSQEADPDPELRLILVGTIDCGKTLTADTLLCQVQTSCSPGSWRSCVLRQGRSHSRRLTLVEAPRWYWSGDRLESSVHEETRRALTLVGPGPHCILLLIPVNQFTEMERRAAQQIEEVFGVGTLRRTLVLLTCGDYLLGRPVEEYLARENQGLREVVGLCGGRYHVINNRRPEDREQVLQLLKKVESMVQGKGGSFGQGTAQPLGSLSSPGLAEQQVVMEKTHGVNAELPFTTTARQPAEAEAAGLTQRMEMEEAESKRRENERLEKEREQRILKERLEAERVERERLEKETEEERLKAVQIEMERREKERREREQQLREETEKKEKERVEAERRRREREERIETERKRQERADRERVENERLEQERVEREKHKLERTEALRREREKAERDMLENERRENERREKERLENETREREKREKERLENERREKERLESERREKERLEKLSERLKQERLENSERVKLDANAYHSQMSPRIKESLEEPPYASEDKIRRAKATSQPAAAAEGAVLSKLSEAAGKGELKEIYNRIVTVGKDPSSSSSSSSSPPPELRLVLLGGTKSGKSSAGNAILGRRDFQTQEDEGTTAVTKCCQKGRAILGNRRVAVVDTPDWFRSECAPDEVRSQLSSCVALSSPGPHAFLLCLPLHRPPPDAMQMLDAVEGVFGHRAVSAHTLLLFTHADVLGGAANRNGNGNGNNEAEGGWGTAEVEEHISSKLPHLLKLVERCGDHYHILERDGRCSSDGGGVVGRRKEEVGGRDDGEKTRKKSVVELLEKVDQMGGGGGGGGGHHSCPIYQEAEIRVRQRQEEILQVHRERRTEQRRRRRGGGEMVGGESDPMVSSGQSVSLKGDLKGEEDEVDEEEEEEATGLETAREEAERSVTLDSEPALAFNKSSTKGPSLVRSAWEKVVQGGSSLSRSAWEKTVQGVKSTPKPLMGGALVGCGLGAFLGGLLGGAVGATGGVALAEVARRKLRSKQTDGAEEHTEGKKNA
ncbi:zinc finger CCCH domain-containing protein 13 [Engraulis encrasicolus]|uniref:zinc finger CCCH domain-containing protein 13 n=1 Tax=Engraulis encrasicolus TaxID=184585 RepID=UPI002FD73463